MIRSDGEYDVVSSLWKALKYRPYLSHIAAQQQTRTLSLYTHTSTLCACFMVQVFSVNSRESTCLMALWCVPACVCVAGENISDPAVETEYDRNNNMMYLCQRGSFRARWCPALVWHCVILFVMLRASPDVATTQFSPRWDFCLMRLRGLSPETVKSEDVWGKAIHMGGLLFDENT